MGSVIWITGLSDSSKTTLAREVLYKRWSSAHKLYIDCASKRVEILL